MNAIQQFDKQNLAQLEKQVIEHLKALSALTGVTFSFKGGRFSNNVSIVKFQMAIPGANGETPEQLYFKKNAVWYNLTPEHLGRKFVDAMGVEWTMDGMRTGRSKYKFIAIRSHDKKRLVLTEYVIKTARWI